MTEVKESPLGYQGLFATTDFQAGDVILEEKPLLVLHHDNDLKPSTSVKVPSSLDPKFHGTFRSMVKVGLKWMDISKENANALLNLYFPTNEASSNLEKAVIDVANEAVIHIRTVRPEYEEWKSLKNAILVWACNSFEGGRIYTTISRVNHSCDPNAIIQPNEDSQKLVAATDIAKGEEIAISYLGSILYADTEVRNERLRRTKFFTCACDRCSTDDAAAKIPCPTCHPREAQQSLDEDTQYDDDQTVRYLTESSPCSKCQTTMDKSGNLWKSTSVVSAKILGYVEDKESASSTRETKKEEDGDDDEILDELISLARTVMGDKHWTTNLLLHVHLDRRLSSMSSAMLTNQETPEMEEIAEIIDSLERVSRFVESLGLKLHPGHLLGDAIIGIARTLVSLGDMKSQKYGAEWLKKIEDFVERFESEGKQKVVSALSVAWKKHELDDSDNAEKSTKKQKRN